MDEAELAEKVAAAKAAKPERGARKAEREAERQEATQASNEKAKEAQIPEKKVAPPAAAKRSSANRFSWAPRGDSPTEPE